MTTLNNDNSEKEKHKITILTRCNLEKDIVEKGGIWKRRNLKRETLKSMIQKRITLTNDNSEKEECEREQF